MVSTIATKKASTLARLLLLRSLLGGYAAWAISFMRSTIGSSVS